MAPIALGSKHQDLLKAYFEVSKTSTPDWASIATKADFQTPKYARDSFTIVKNKLLATATSDSINLSERHIALLKATLEVMKAEVCPKTCNLILSIQVADPAQTDWEKVASAANFTTSKYARDSWAILKTKLCGGKAKSDTASPRKTPTKAKAVKATQSRKRKKPEGEMLCRRHATGNQTNRPNQQTMTTTMVPVSPPRAPTRGLRPRQRRSRSPARSRSRSLKLMRKVAKSL
jgi:hypothetical protein